MRILKWLLAVIASLAIAWFLVFGSIRLPASTISNEEEQEIKTEDNYVNDIQLQPRVVPEFTMIRGRLTQPGGYLDFVNVSTHTVRIDTIEVNGRCTMPVNLVLNVGDVYTLMVTKPLTFEFPCGYMVTVDVKTDRGIIRFKPQQQ